MDNYKIYPKEFRNENILIQKNKCFMIMPFDSKFDLLYGSIKEALEIAGYNCVRADDISGSTAIMNKILKEMLSAQFVIADLSTLNANVFYELGIAHSFKDAKNVIIIKEKNEKCPFDLTHLSYIEYSHSNFKYLTSSIIKYLNDAKYISDFYEMLNLKGIINLISDNTEDFVGYMLSNFDKYIANITEILLGNNDYTDNQLNDLLIAFEKHIIELYQIKASNIIPGIIKIYFELLIQTADSKKTDNHIENFVLNEFSKFDNMDRITDLMIDLASNKKMFTFSMNWLIERFSCMRVTNIDLNRHKIERFLLLSDDPDVNNSITNALYSSNCYIRERMADIIGEKRLVNSVPVLYSVLTDETNNYTTRSILYAISKIDPPDGLNHIKEWLNEHIDQLLENRDYFMFNHVLTCIKRIDHTEGNIYVKEFKKTFQKYLN